MESGTETDTLEITFYCGINESRWNYSPVSPGPYACVSPVMHSTKHGRIENRVAVPEGVKVIQDSGAFSDSPENRLTPEQALTRQLKHAEKYKYLDKVTHIASYDLLIDEKWHNGRRTKERWTEQDAISAVKTTVSAAEWLALHRDSVPSQGLILSAQGVTSEQYLECAKQIFPLLDNERDIFGMGGWCITGKMRKQMLPVFKDTYGLVLPQAAAVGVKQIHIWGVIFAPALALAADLCKRHNMKLSTDSAGPQRKPSFGSWGYADWINKSYERPPTSVRGIERAKHVEAVREWLKDFPYPKYINK